MKSNNTATVPLLHFGTGNAKLFSDTATFALPAGYSCPGAKSCLARFDRDDRKIRDGPQQKHRCFFASMESIRPSLAKAVMRNFEMLKTAKTREKMAALISASLPGRIRKVRIHVGGDFFSEPYFLAWTDVAKSNPDILFYAYTASLHIWSKNVSSIPDNMTLCASRGGKFDAKIEEFGLRSSVVVYHPDEAEAKGLKIDHDDSLASDSGVKEFALLLHGSQPSKSEASAALKRMRDESVNYSYTKNKK